MWTRKQKHLKIQEWTCGWQVRKLYFQWLFELKVIKIILTFQLQPKTTKSKIDVGPLFLGLGKEAWDLTFLMATSYARNSPIIMSTCQ